MNSRKTTPNSATGAISAKLSRVTAEMKDEAQAGSQDGVEALCAKCPNPNGPRQNPAARKPRIGLSFSRRNSGATTPAVVRKIRMLL